MPFSIAHPQDPRLEVVAGDVSDPSSLENALKGCKGAIFTASGKGFWSAHGVDHMVSPVWSEMASCAQFSRFHSVWEVE